MQAIRFVPMALIGVIGTVGCADGDGPTDARPLLAQVAWTEAQVRQGSFAVQAIAPSVVEITGTFSGTCMQPWGISATPVQSGGRLSVRLVAEVSNSVCQVETTAQYRVRVALREGDPRPDAVVLTHAVRRGNAYASDTLLALPRP